MEGISAFYHHVQLLTTEKEERRKKSGGRGKKWDQSELNFEMARSTDEIPMTIQKSLNTIPDLGSLKGQQKGQSARRKAKGRWDFRPFLRP